jgi:hypothetical protein
VEKARLPQPVFRTPGSQVSQLQEESLETGTASRKAGNVRIFLKLSPQRKKLAQALLVVKDEINPTWEHCFLVFFVIKLLIGCKVIDVEIPHPFETADPPDCFVEIIHPAGCLQDEGLLRKHAGRVVLEVSQLRCEDLFQSGELWRQPVSLALGRRVMNLLETSRA